MLVLLYWASQRTVVLSSNNSRLAKNVHLCAKQSVFMVLQNVPSLYLGDLIPQALISSWFHCGYGSR